VSLFCSSNKLTAEVITQQKNNNGPAPNRKPMMNRNQVMKFELVSLQLKKYEKEVEG
jgi:hypothetical protein